MSRTVHRTVRSTTDSRDHGETPPRTGLAALADVQLDPVRRQRLADACALCTGDAVWKRRKQAEARELLQLEMIAPRLSVDFIDLRTELRLLVQMRVPVACRPQAAAGLMIGGAAVLGITYPREAMWQVMPGYAFVQVLAPSALFYPNVAAGHDQRLCLGAQLPPGIRLREIVLGSYGALSMQTVQLDERDHAGVMNREAAHWWQANLRKIPLSTVPFLGTADLDDLENGATRSTGDDRDEGAASAASNERDDPDATGEPGETGHNAEEAMP